MHKSRLGVLVIDCYDDTEMAENVQFWSRALGCEPKFKDSAPDYAELETPSGEIKILLQQVDHGSRVHLDIETDDQDAEVARLEALGAKRIAQIKQWWVMEAPSGHRFCVVGPQRDTFEDHANVWE